MKNRTRSTVVVPLESGLARSSTLGEFLEVWLTGKRSLRPSTRLSYESHVRRYLVPILGAVVLDDLGAQMIDYAYRRIQDDARRPVSDSTLRRVHATLHSALATAVRRGLIERNPASTVELPRVPRVEMRTWSGFEVASFMSATREDRLNCLFWLLVTLGLRRGEALALRWSDLELNKGLCAVRQSSTRVGGLVVVGPPKSSSGERVLALDAETVRRLTWHQCRQRLELLRVTNETRSPDLVFTDPGGLALDPAYVSRRFDRLSVQHGLPRIRLHDLRHTSASLGLESGESLVEVSRRLGHSSIAITADTYSHISPEVARPRNAAPGTSSTNL